MSVPTISRPSLTVYLIDTNVISESRKRLKADRGVRQLFKRVAREETRVFISVVTVTRNHRDFAKTGVRLLNTFST